MTNFGVFGTILSIDEDENQVLLETSPGTVLTVHRQTIARVVEPAEVERRHRGRLGHRRRRARVRRARRRRARPTRRPTPRSRTTKSSQPRGSARALSRGLQQRKQNTVAAPSKRSSRPTPVRKAWRSLTWLGVIIVGLFAINAAGVIWGGGSWTPKLALDLEGGTQIILEPQGRDRPVRLAGAARPGRLDHPPARRRVGRLRGRDQHRGQRTSSSASRASSTTRRATASSRRRSSSSARCCSRMPRPTRRSTRPRPLRPPSRPRSSSPRRPPSRPTAATRRGSPRRCRTSSTTSTARPSTTPTTNVAPADEPLVTCDVSRHREVPARPGRGRAARTSSTRRTAWSPRRPAPAPASGP